MALETQILKGGAMSEYELSSRVQAERGLTFTWMSGRKKGFTIYIGQVTISFVVSDKVTLSTSIYEPRSLSASLGKCDCGHVFYHKAYGHAFK